ncbi:MAG: FMN-binding protein [Alkalispirochaeta sp.]
MKTVMFNSARTVRRAVRSSLTGGIVLAAVLVALGCSQGPYTDGTYQAAARGHYDDITVEVEVQRGKIAEIEIVDSSETPSMLAPVRDTMIPRIIDEQSTEDIDTISGATDSSSAVLEAVSAALDEARNTEGS